MKKIGGLFLLVISMVLVGCTNSASIVKSNKIDEAQVLLNRSNKIPLSFDLTFNNLFIKNRKTRLFVEHYQNGRLIEREGLLSSSVERNSHDSTQAKINILTIGKTNYVNFLYDESAMGSKKINFAKTYEIYDYDKLEGNIRVNKDKKVVLGYFGGSDNQNLARPLTARDVKVKNYAEIITIVLETSDK